MKFHIRLLVLMGLMIMAVQSVGGVTTTANREERFSLATSDRRTHIHGLLALPKNVPGSMPVPVIIVGGSVSSRDGAAYVLQSDPAYLDKFWYATLSVALLKAGFATIRYDDRGIGSGLECDRILGFRAGPDQYVESAGRCYDARSAATTTFITKRQDIASVVAMVNADKRLDARRSIIIGHSEAGVHLAGLLAQSLIRPAGMVLIGVPIESLDAIHRWQHIDRQWEWMARLVDEHGGSIDNADAEKYYLASASGYDRSLAAASGRWSSQNLAELRSRLTQLRANDVATALAVPAGSLATGNMDKAIEGVVVGSIEYYQSLISDKVSAVGALAGYSGAIAFIYGGRDISVSPRRQIDLIRKNAALNSHARVVVLDGIDHNLAGANGHLVPAGIDAVVDAVRHTASREERH